MWGHIPGIWGAWLSKPWIWPPVPGPPFLHLVTPWIGEPRCFPPAPEPTVDTVFPFSVNCPPLIHPPSEQRPGALGEVGVEMSSLGKPGTGWGRRAAGVRAAADRVPEGRQGGLWRQDRAGLSPRPPAGLSFSSARGLPRLVQELGARATSSLWTAGPA